jgi:hypothetical protein
MLVVGLRGLLLYCAPAVPPAVSLVNWQSCGRGLVNGHQLWRGPQKGHFAKAGYRLLSLALMQAVAWLSEGNSTLSGERREMCCVVKRLLPCGCSHKC